MKALIAAMIGMACAASLAACFSASIGEDGIGVKLGPVASLERVKEGEDAMAEQADAFSETIQKLADGQITLAEAMGEAEVAAAAAQAAADEKAADMKAEMQKQLRDAKDEVAMDPLTMILICLGGGMAGTGGVMGAGAYRKKLLNAKPPGEAAKAA